MYSQASTGLKFQNYHEKIVVESFYTSKFNFYRINIFQCSRKHKILFISYNQGYYNYSAYWMGTIRFVIDFWVEFKQSNTKNLENK